MVPSTRMIGQVFCSELARKIETLPGFIRPQLEPTLRLLLDWAKSIETRVAAIEKEAEAFQLLPEAPAIALAPGVTLCAPAETATAAAARIQAEIDRCGGACDE